MKTKKELVEELCEEYPDIKYINLNSSKGHWYLQKGVLEDDEAETKEDILVRLLGIIYKSFLDLQNTI